MVHPVQVRPINNDEGSRRLRIVAPRRGVGGYRRRTQMLLLSTQGMPVAKMAEYTFTSSDCVCDGLHNYKGDGFDSFYPRYARGRPMKVDLKRGKIEKIALSRPGNHGLAAACGIPSPPR